MVAPSGHPSLAGAESDRPAHPREANVFGCLVGVWIDADELLIAVVECPEGGAVPADRVRRVARTPAPRAGVVRVHAVRRAPLGPADVGSGDRNRRHHFAGRALDLADCAVAHVGDEGPLAAERDRTRGLPHFGPRDHGPVRGLRSWGGSLRLCAGTKHPDREHCCREADGCNSLSILNLLHSSRLCLLLSPETGPRPRALISSPATRPITSSRARP